MKTLLLIFTAFVLYFTWEISRVSIFYAILVALFGFIVLVFFYKKEVKKVEHPKYINTLEEIIDEINRK